MLTKSERPKRELHKLVTVVDLPYRLNFKFNPFICWYGFNLTLERLNKNTRVIQQLLACEEGRGGESANHVLREVFAM